MKNEPASKWLPSYWIEQQKEADRKYRRELLLMIAVTAALICLFAWLTFQAGGRH